MAHCYIRGAFGSDEMLLDGSTHFDKRIPLPKPALAWACCKRSTEVRNDEVPGETGGKGDDREETSSDDGGLICCRIPAAGLSGPYKGRACGPCDHKELDARETEAIDVKDVLNVWVGSYGYYAEGELRDQMLSLPVEGDGEIADWLREVGLVDDRHEEVYISDYDEMPFDCPNLFGEFADLGELNLLAKLMRAMPEEAERVRMALACGIDGPGSLVGLMNWIVQADDIPYHEYSESRGCGSPEERYGRSVAEGDGTMELLEARGLESYFDFGLFGRDASQDAYLGGDGYVDACCGMPDEDLCSLAEIEEMAA